MGSPPIRRAQPDDLRAIVAIYNHAILHTTATFDITPFAVGERRAWFAQFDDVHPLYVADDEGATAAFAYYLPYRPKPGYAITKEVTVYVEPTHHGRGVGSALLGVLVDHARKAGVHTLVSVIAGDNPASDAIHEKHGFVPIGTLREVGTKFGAWVDTRIWQLVMTDSGPATDHVV